MLARPLGIETVTILRAALITTGRDDELVRDWDNASQTVLKQCNVQSFVLSEKFLAEDDKDREFLRASFRVWAPAGSDVLYTDRAIWRGVTYEVLGVNQQWSHIMGPAHHVAFLLRERVG